MDTVGLLLGSIFVAIATIAIWLLARVVIGASVAASSTETGHRRQSDTQSSDRDHQRQEIDRLNAEISRIKEAGRKIIRQRDEARKELMSAQAEIFTIRQKLRSSVVSDMRAPSEGEDRFRQAKRAFAQKFHPDKCQATGFDRIVREQVFKEFWADLESIEKRDR